MIDIYPLPTLTLDVGDWSQTSQEWEMYPEINEEIMQDHFIPWKRDCPNGFLWMSYRSFLKYFSTTYLVKLFPSEKFDFYCARGVWEKGTAGGPVHTIRDRAVVVQVRCKGNWVNLICHN
jgi:hypothetical protein